MAPRKKAAAKKSARSAAEKPAERAASSGSKNSISGAIFHGGKLYSGKRKGDAEKLAAALENEKAKNPEKYKVTMRGLQARADKGHLVGFGTTARSGKAKAENKPGRGGRARAEAEAAGEGEEGLSPDEQAGGGVDVTEDPDAAEE